MTLSSRQRFGPKKVSKYHSTSSSTVKDSANGTSKLGKSFFMFALKEPFMSAGKKNPFTFHFQSETYSC